MLHEVLHGTAQFLGVEGVTCQKKGAGPRCCLCCNTLFRTLLHTFVPYIGSCFMARVLCAARQWLRYRVVTAEQHQVYR